MRLKHLTLIAIFCIFSNSLVAQIESFKLSDYKLPDLKRQGIDIKFGLGGNQYEDKYIGEVGDNKKSSYNGNLVGNYFLYRNTRKYQGTISTSVNGRYSFNKEKKESSDFHKYIYTHSGFSASSNNRFYFRNDFFIGLEAFASISTNLNERKEEDIDNNSFISENKWKGNSLGYRTSLPISIGRGRIEPVEDARHTLFILSELKKNARLTREPTNEEILFLAAKISEIKNERVLDARLKKIYELQQLDSVLLSMNLVEKKDISYFTTINDMWDFGGLQSRDAGVRVSLVYTPDFRFSKFVGETEESDYVNNTYNYSKDRNSYKDFGNSLGVNFNCSKPFRQKFQSDFSTRIEYGFHKEYNKSEEIQPERMITESESERNLLRGSLFYNFDIYPNTRTSFSLGAFVNGAKRWLTDKQNDVETDYESYNYGGRLSLSFNYYISPKIKLDFSYSTYYGKENNRFNTDEKRESFDHSSRLSFLYSIF